MILKSYVNLYSQPPQLEGAPKGLCYGVEYGGGPHHPVPGGEVGFTCPLLGYSHGHLTHNHTHNGENHGDPVRCGFGATGVFLEYGTLRRKE